jgi:hypothetical protein
MQPTSSSVNTPPTVDRTVMPNRATSDDSTSTLRVDAPTDLSNIVKAPHGPVALNRSASTRIRGERPHATPLASSSSAGSVSELDTPDSEAAETSSNAMESAGPKLGSQTHLPTDDSLSTETNWGTLHAEDISRILDQRLFEVERRERLLNRRAAQVAQQERMFRLWANDTRFELERKRRELQQFESELTQRSHDLRWLLVHGEQFDSSELASRSAQHDQAFESDLKRDRKSIEEDLYSQIEELELKREADGVRRVNR